MKRNEFYYLSADGKTKIHGAEWLPEREPKAVLQISHGVTEHILRYEEMAEYFTKQGFVVVGNDDIGHGTSIAEGAEPMYFGPKDSWLWVQRDMYTCLKMTKKRYPKIPYILLGFSLGSFVVRTFLIRHPGKVDGVILAGTGQPPAWQLALVRLIADSEGRKAGEAHSTPLIKALTFGNYNRHFAPNRTDYDWLCASEKALDDYIADSLRGEAMSAGLFREMLNGMMFTGSLKNQERMDKETPILLVSGEEDPVGECGKGVKRTCHSFQKAGIKDVSQKLYPGLRHDIFREDIKEQVFCDVCRWIEEKCLKERMADEREKGKDEK